MRHFVRGSLRSAKIIAALPAGALLLYAVLTW